MSVATRTNNTPGYLLLCGAILTIIAVSGFGHSINVNEVMAISFAFVASIYAFLPYNNIPPLGKLTCLFVLLSCCVIALNVMLSEFNVYKIVNFTSLFGLLIGTGIISELKWENMNMYRIGLMISSFALIVIYLFLPGHLLYGWNSNSAIFLIPILLLGMSLIYCSGEVTSRKKYIGFYSCALVGFALISSLDNRSSLLALCLFSVIPLFPWVLSNQKCFRWIYAVIIAMGVITPFFQDYIANNELFQDIISLTKGDKMGGFNGREISWHKAVGIIEENPMMGKEGWRVIYFHNFSLDVLIQYGWLGWVTFSTIVIVILERCFVPGSKYNILLYAFIVLLLLNTYENAFLANNYFTIFPYFLTGIAWRYAKQKQQRKIVWTTHRNSYL